MLVNFFSEPLSDYALTRDRFLDQRMSAKMQTVHPLNYEIGVGWRTESTFIPFK